MKKLFILVFLFSGVSIFAQSAAEIIKKAEQKMRGESSYAEMKITTVRPKWSREMTLKSWSKGKELAMILITAPAREKGTVFLKNNKDVWNWVPSIERNIKLPPSMMSQSWMGTDLSNDDLVRETEKDDDYTHQLLGEEMINGRLCWKIEMTPKEDAAVVWGKIISWIDKKEYVTLKSELYDEDELLVNIMNAYDIKNYGGVTLPSRMEIIPVEKEGHKTIMEYVRLEFNIKIEDTFFSIQNMSKVK